MLAEVCGGEPHLGGGCVFIKLFYQECNALYYLCFD